MAIDSRVKALYDALKADGADVGTEEEFNAYMFKPGKEGYQNRYAVYKAFKDDGADIGASYEEFGKWLGLQAVAPKPAAKPAATPAPKQTAAPKPTEYFKLRRGGVDFTVPTAEVNAAGGLGGWAKAHPGAPIRVYMSGKKADGTAFDGHVDLSEAHNRRKNSGYKYTTVSAPIQRAVKPAAPAKPQQPWKPSAIQQMALSQQLAQSQANLQSVIDQGKQQRENLAKGYKLGAGLGEREFNPTTGKMETVYYTKQGDRVHSKMEQAYHNSAADMSVGAQLRRANERLASYEAKMEERAKTLQKEHEDNQPGGFLGFLRGMGEAMAGDKMGGNLGQTPEDYIEFQTDKEYQAYRLAARKAREEIQQLENKRDQEANGKGFWRGFGRGTWQAIANVDAWDFGKNAFRDASTVMQVANDAKTKNLTPAQEEAMYELYLSNAVQEQFGDLGRGYRWGDIAGSSLSFMKDFLLTGGFSGLSTKLPEKAAVAMAKKGAQRMATNAATNFGEQVAKEGLFNFVRAGGKGAVTRLLAEQGLTGTAKILTIKALGVGAEDLLIRAPLMTGTIQGQSTAAKIINGKYGPVRVDENTGELSFAEEKGWGEAAWQEGADHVIENFSEMWGAHLPGMADVSRVFGARNLTAAILRTTREGAGTMLSKTSNFLRNAGVNGYLGEVGEEYYGQLWRTGLFLDSAKDKNGRNNFFNPDFHGDIWGGMALSIGMTGGGAMAVNYGARGGAAAYYMYLRHNVNKADAKASQVFGADEWNLMKALIDSADNGAVANLADQTMRDQEMPDEQREALMDYMEKSMILRGHNLGEMVKSRAEEADENEEALNESYINGYEGITPQEMVDAQNMFNKQRERIEGILEADEIAELESNPIMAIREMSNNDLYSQEQRDAALDYISAKIVLNGMQQRISDDIDVQIAQSDAAIMSRVNKVTGMIQPAVLNGVDDKHVFIVHGYVAINDDGTIDRSDSDKTIIVKDAQTGTVEFANPKDIVSLGEALDPEEQRAAAVDAIRMEAEQRATEAMSGKLPMNPGDVITIKDSTGTHPVTIVGTPADEEGNPTGEIIVAFEDGSQYDIAPDTLQQLADEANRERVDKFDEERIAEREAQREAAQHPQFALNDVFTVTGPDGETINGQISGEVNEDGMVEVQTDQPINGNVVNLFTPEELMNLAETYNGEPLKQEEAPAETPTDAAETNAGEDETAAQTALSQIPLDDNGQPMLTETTPDLAWDGIVESAHGDEEIAAETAKDYLDEAEADLKAAEKALKQAQEAKPTKRKPGDPAPTLDERIAAKEAAKQALEQAQGAFDNAQRVRDHWAKVVETKQRREAAIRAQQEAEARQRAAERAEAEKAEREAREEAARLEREALEGIPEWHLDTPENARKRGVRRFSGQMFTRQEPVQGVVGKEVEVKFSQKDLPKGHLAVIEAPQLQPSHIQGQRNPMFFIEEAQPKNRAEAVSMFAAKEMAEGIRPQEITGSATAYTGAPTVNTRGEVIQGNNRSDALRYLWENKLPEQQQTYKQYLIDNAEQFGLDPEAVNAMQQPVLVNMLDVDDAEAIRLGQMTAQDTESGGIERIKPKNVAQKLGEDMRSFASQLLRSGDEEASFSQLVDRNGTEVMKWMAQKGAITNTQYQSAFDSKGNLTAEAKNDLQKVLYQAVFKGGSQQLEEMFDALPAKAQRAILSTAFRDMDSPFAGKMLPEIQSSIAAFNQLMNDPTFAAAKKMEEVLRAVEGFKRQTLLDDRFEQYMPADNFSNFALHLAAMYKASDMSQSTLASYFNQMYDLAQGKKAATLFEEADTTEYPLAEVIKKVLNIEYQPAKNGNNNVANGGADVALRNQDGQGGELRGNEPPASGEQNPTGTEPSDRGGGTASNSGQGLIGRSLTAEEAETLIKSMEASAEQAQSLELTPENWIEQFGEDGRVDTPMGEVKLGENQFIKLYSRGRAEYFGMMRPTLVNPDVIIEKNAPAEGAERDTKYIFVKTFTKADGSRIVHFESITVRRDGMEVSVSSHEAEAKDIKKDMQNGKILHISNKLPLSSEWSLTEAPEEGPDLVPTPDSVVSDDKDNTSSSEKQENDGKSSLGQQIEEASKDVNTNPSEGQKEAGNYKKGHVQVGTFDVTIEQPVGSIRRNKDANGKEWETEMKHTYGYIRGSEGVDGDHIDVFISADIDGWNGRKAFVVDQYNPDGSFDEHKVMLGFNDKGEAFAAYLANYEKGWEKGRRLDCTEVNMEDFEKWIASSHRKTKPFTEYKSVKPAESAHSAIYQQNYDKFFNSYLQAIENNQIPDVKAIKAELAKIKKSIKTIEDGMAVNVNSDEDRIKAETRLEQLYGLRDAYAAALADIEKRMNGTEDSNFTLEDIEALREYNYNFAKRDESHKGLTASAIKEKIKSLEKDVEELLSIGYFATKSEAYGKQGIIRYLKELLADTEAKDEAQGYTVDEYTDRKKRKYFRVKFPRADKNVLKQRLNLAEKMGGAKVPLGYGFATKEEAEAFADKVMNDPKALADAQPLSLDDVKTATGMQEVNLEGVIKDLQEHGETNLADHSTRVEATPTEQKPTESEPEKKPVNPSGNKLVTDEQYEALLKRLKDKMGGQLNMGIDPEILAIGVQLAVYHIEKGARKFAAYVKALSADLERMGILDQFPKRYLKGFYKNAHEMLEEDAPELAAEMDSDEEVNRSDVATIISGHTDPLATAEVISGEQEAEKERKKAEEELKRQREEREASDKWIYDIKRGAGGELTLTRMTDSPVPIEDGRFRITARNVAELEGIIKNPANGLEHVLRGKTEIYKDVSVLLGMLRHEETHKGDQAKTDGTLDLAEPETKDAKELEGDSAQFQKAEQQRNALVSEIALNIEMRVQSLAKDSETKPLTMTEVKKLAKGYIELKGIADTDLQELVELAMTQLTRKVARDAMFKSAEEQRIAYDTIVKYYRMQPSLNARDSERLMKQQYSTPTPFGFVMGQFLQASGNEVMSMLEPSAGNGALTIAVAPSAVHANDIDEARLANLRKLKFGKVTAQDALLPFGFGIYDAISTNPPFGTVAERVYDGVFKISSLEGQMAINALDAMKDNGRAAIVIGGNTSYRKNGSMNPKDAAFFGYLYSHYNVADVINISGKALYSRNGTGYDVRIILIDGRKEGAFKRTFPPVQADARAEQITTFEELYNRVQDDILRIQEQNNGTAATDVQSETRPTADGGSRAAIRNGSHSTDGGQRGQSGTGSPVRGGSPRVGTQQPVGGHDTAGADGLGDGHRGDAGNTHAVQGGNSGQNSGGLSTGSVGDGGRRSRGTEPQQPSAQSDNNRERLAIKPDLGTEKVDYPAQSGNGFTLLSVVPAAQADVLRKSLGEIGDVDQFLVDELGYSSKEELYGYLAAEQIDSVALAINQMNQGNAFIIGDMTGVGKGRQGAALIRYAVKHGKKPIYFTQKPTLFTDNYRDLADIGSGNLRPFIIASDPKEANIVDADGKVVHRLPSKKEKERVFKYIMEHGTLPDEYDYALCTYSQVQNGTSDYEQRDDGTWQVKPKSSKGGKAAATDAAGQIRRDVLSTLAQGNYVYLDESHTVGGDSGCGRYMQMLTSATEGVTFLSATFAKRADNMPIYAQRTDLSRAEITPKELIAAIAKGGVTLQEIMSRQLVESGQMIRRERSFEGVNIDWLPVPEETDRKQRAQFNEVAEIFNAIRNFQDDYITPLIEAMSGEAASSGGYVDHTKGTKDMGVQNTPFASKMYNLVNQLLFALKVDAVADRVVENLRNGFKPVISFTNTMEGFLEEAPIGVEMDEMPNFSLTLQWALDGVMRFTETDADNNKTSDSISFGELSQAGKQTYNSIRERIAALSADLPISPMDAIRMKIEEAGYSVREITGRKLQLTKTEEGKYVVKSREDRDKKAAMRDFNNGQLDVLMINKSGSTGISLHASSKFADQRQRVMVFAQFQSDINDEVQMRGRIDRSGQVVRGRYEYIMSSIPAEQRLQMMFKAKLKSLDANTTSSQKSKFNEMEVVDYLNKYGDEVVWEYMKEHPELSERLGDPLDMLSDDKENGPRTRDKENKKKKNDCAAKLSRYLAFLSVEEQDEIFKEITDAYRVKIQLLDDAGENDLEITTMPLRAKTKSRKMWHEGSEPGGRNSFADNTYVEEVEVDVLKKPMKRAEILEQQRKLLGEEFVDEDGTINWDRYKRKKGDEITAYYVAKADETIAKLTEQGEARIAKAKEKAIKDAITLRAQGKNNLTDEQIRQLGEEVANEQREKEETKRQNRRAEILGPQARIRGLMNRFRAGTIYAIPNDLANATPGLFTPTFGTFVGFKFNKTYTIGSSTAIFATLDGRRKVEVSLRDKALDTIYESTNNAYRYARNEINAISMDNWDSHVPTLTRQTRHIITGNLLQALVDVAKGERMGGNLISYTTMDGEVRQGILMGENFKESDLRNSVPISARLAQIRNGVKVASEDGDVEIEKIMYGYQHRGDYTLTVPKSKQRGGKYTMNKDLLSLVYGHNFTTSGNKMVGYVEERNLARVLDLLSRQPLGVTVLEESKLQDTPKESNEDGDNILYRLRERFSKKQRAIFAARERQRMVERIQELAERMHLDNVEVVTDVSQLEGKRAKAKGFYNKRTGKITIVIPNNVSTIDAEQTLLHEAVAHYGLRQLFGGQFDTFLDNVYQSADESIRHKIADMAAKNGWDFRTATEEYLAGLAEDTDFARAKEHAGWWTTIKRLFLDMLEKIGFEGFRDKVGVVLTDNELRYILWRSYHNLAEPGGWKSILGEAEDVAKQAELEVGNYAEKGIDAERVAEVREAEAQSAYHEMIDAVFSGNADRETYGMRYYHVANTPLFMTAVGLRGAEFTIPFKAIATHWGKDGDHRMTPDEWHRLPTALQRPFLITKYEGKADRFRIYTSLKLGGKHVVVGVDVKRVNQGRNKPMLEINSIKTVFAQSGRMAESEEIVCYDKEITPEQEALLGGRNFRQYPTVQELEAKVRENSEDTKDSDENMLFRPGDFSPRDQVLARDYYNRVVATGSYQFKEAVQDSMLGLKKLYQAILGRGTRIEDVPGFENAYLFENRMSSMNAGEQHEYFIRYMKPLLKTIGEICGSNDRKRRELTDYLMAKHGLERNAYMRQEAAANNEDTDRDFAGLMGLTGEPDWQSAEATAQDWVDNYEGEHDTNELWNNINAATKATLEKVYLSGIISKETYEKTRDMYDYYIPLRGWNQTTSDEVYGYLMSKDGPLGGSIMKSAHGRSSMADDPIATIAMMADDAIRQGNRNCMKQRFLNFILNHPSDTVSVHDIWLEYDDTIDEWRPVFADVEDTDSAEEVAQKVEAFEANMEQLRQQYPDRYKKGREAANIPYKVVKDNLKEHQILIKRNGRTFVATINGNPRAAQAVNGLTNPDVETGGVVGNMLKLGQYVNRQLSAFYTTRNPDFVISNFFRDMLYSNCMTWVKESPRYALRFHKNFGRVNPAMMRRLLAKWEKGKLNQGNRLEKLFYQFMKNGGETGYTNVRDIESHKKAIAAELKKQGRSIGLRAWTALGMQLDLLNRSAENCARFAAFVTSRDFGRSIDRAIYDAKEVSVNFNKKGSGGKMVNAVGQTKLGKFGSYLSGGGRLLYVFWNAGVQGLTNVGRAAKLHPGKFTAGASALFALGYVIPLLAQMLGGGDGDDDDKNSYYNLPEYVRRSNICFYVGDQWVTIPLPIEYRAIYGLGELAHGVISGNERYTNRELAYQLTSQVSQIMPIDMLEGGGGINPFIPSAFKPYAEAYIMNKGWTGLPVYKDTPFNKNAPEWSKAYASADRHIVAFTKWLNETTGGDDFKKGAIDINPAKIEYLLNGTFGGLFTFPNKVKKTGETMFGDRDFEWRNIPLANRLVKSGDERTANRKLQNEYFKYKNEYERTGTLMRQYENAEEGGALEYAEKVAFLEGSPEYARWQVFDDFKTDLDDYRQEIAEETDKSVRVQLEAEYYAMMRELVDALHNPEAYLKAATQSQQPNR